MATFPDLSVLLSDLTALPKATTDAAGIKIREAGMISKSGRGPRSAAEMASSDAAMWTIALLVPHERKGDFIAEVNLFADLPLTGAHYTPRTGAPTKQDTRLAFQFLKGLGVIDPDNHTIGSAITALIDDFRSGQFNDWRGDEHANITVEFHHRDKYAQLFVDRARINESAVLGYGARGKRAPEPVETITRIHMLSFVAIAKTLGPLT